MTHFYRIKGTNADEVERFSSDYTLIHDEIMIFTLEGTMAANVGDYIIKGVKGKVYPCKPDIFEMTYERVTGGSTATL